MQKRELRVKGEYKEKDIYSFYIEKEIEFEGEDFYILKNEYKKNHLLSKKYYADYNLYIGQTIPCYVDKINCAGEIFLEPAHPFYKLNESYSFKLVESGINKYKDIIEFGLFVKDIYNKNHFVICTREFAIDALKNSSIILKLERIKKGNFHLKIISK